MSSNRKFYQTIKFKITFWYSLMFFILGGIMLLIVNALVSDVLNKPPRSTPFGSTQYVTISETGVGTIEMSEDEKERLTSFRKNDLEFIQDRLIWTLIPLLIISTAGGWIIANSNLQPLNILNNAIKSIKLGDKNELKYNSKDEIGEIIQNFNEMSERLNIMYLKQKQFIDDASHELKTPLGIMNISIDEILDNTAASENDFKELLLKNKKKIKEMNKLVENLLFLAKSDTLNNSEKIDINMILNDTIEDLDKLIKTNNVKVKVVNKYKGIYISANKMLISRVFENIIENSIKYRSKDKKCTIDVKFQKIDEFVHVQIKDNGIGIPKDKLNKVFDRFFRVENSRSKETGGFGLGLSIVKKIIDNYKGDISINSEVGKGTEIVVKLPIIK